MREAGGDRLDNVSVHWGTFLDTPPAEADRASARAVVVLAPYDGTTSYRGGARHGPRAIVAASRHLEDYDLELDRDVSRIGIYTMPELAPAATPADMVERVHRTVRPLAGEGKLVALLGGEHTVTVGAVGAMAAVYPNLSVLYLDAHADLRDSYMGSTLGHATVARRLHEICPMVQVGVRSVAEEEKGFIEESGTPVFFWAPKDDGPAYRVDSVVDGLSDQVYVTVDLDVFDPSIMAAVGTPEPGGMGWADVTGLLRAVGARRKIVGFDVTELSPGEGPEACAYTAAKLVYKLMGYATSGP